MTTIADRLNIAMEKYQIGVRELSRRTGINAGDITRYRRGEYEPKREKIYLLSKALNVSPGWLMGLDLPEHDVLADQEILDMWHKLSEDHRRLAADYIAALIEDQT